jgi:predicted transcriptional regulator
MCVDIGLKMSRRRSRLEVMLNVLSAVRDGSDKPTRIMYASNLSWKPSQMMLSYLVEQGLVELMIIATSGKSRKRYVITEKGVNVLDYFEKANEVLPVEEYAYLYSKVPG